MESVTREILKDLSNIDVAKKLTNDKSFESKVGKRICSLLDKYESEQDKEKYKKEIEEKTEGLRIVNESTSLILCKVVTELSKKGSSEVVSGFMEQLWQSLSDAQISKHTDGPKFMVIKYFVMVQKKMEAAFIKELVGILGRYRELRFF